MYIIFAMRFERLLHHEHEDKRSKTLWGPLNITHRWPIHPRKETDIINGRECSKKSAQQGRSSCDARSVPAVREHDTRARTPLVGFFQHPQDGEMAVSFVLASLRVPTDKSTLLLFAHYGHAER